MIAAMRIFRALCLAGIVVGLAVALLAPRDTAGAEPLPLTVPTTTTASGPGRLGQADVGLTGPIGVGVEGTTAVGTVPGWPHPSWPKLGWPAIDTGGLALAVGALLAVAVARR